MNSALMDLSNSMAEAVERSSRCVVSVNEGGRSGVSGTIWRDDVVVTAEHTIRDHQEVSIVLPTGASSGASIIGRDPTTDIAVLRLKDSTPASIEFTDASKLRVGHIVLAIGRRAKYGVVATRGIISAFSGEWRTWQGGRIDHWFRLDLQAFTGFSGGPLVDFAGQVVGINTSGPRRSVMTIPALTVDRVVEQLLTKGRITRGFIGVALQPVRLPASVGSSSGNEATRGLLTVMVEPGGPAEKAGLLVGDIVVALGDTSLTSLANLQAVLDPEQVGKKLQLRVLRGGKPHDVTVLVSERTE